MNDYYNPDGEDVSDILNDSTCVWKKTMMLNAKGEGTTFDINNLPKTAEKCYRCTGFEYTCKQYITEGESRK